jgi:hypothetical protein
MEKALRFFLIGVLGFILAVIAASVAHSKPEYSKQEKTPCTTCHTKAGAKELNEVGKCYEKKHSLKDCQAPKDK